MTKENPLFLLLPGGSSPFHADHEAVYKLISDEAENRQWDVKMLSYHGDGQYPDPGRGLDLIANAVSVRDSLATGIPEGSMLFCRCYGCYVGAYLLAYYPEVLAHVEKVVFWAPATYWYMWKCAYTDRNSLGEFNQYARKRGYLMADNYFQTLLPMECLVTKFGDSPKRLMLACGTEDPSCRPEDIDYLGGVVHQWTPWKAKTVIVSGARHAVHPQDPRDVIEGYMRAIFCE
jgi:pimeloyl-ACP methyl ester carboxylesterase